LAALGSFAAKILPDLRVSSPLQSRKGPGGRDLHPVPGWPYAPSLHEQKISI
jgi:hypothetical protein